MVKLADRITNLEPPPDTWSHDKRRAYLDEAALIRDALGEASAHLARRLEAKMADYRGLLSP
jgi:(p)ppGpp synthase/HD superfamily hydrolase